MIPLTLIDGDCITNFLNDGIDLELEEYELETIGFSKLNLLETNGITTSEEARQIANKRLQDMIYDFKKEKNSTYGEIPKSGRLKIGNNKHKIFEVSIPRDIAKIWEEKLIRLCIEYNVNIKEK